MMYFSQDLTRAPWLTQTLKDLYQSDAVLADAGAMLEALKRQDANYAKARLKGKTLHEALGVANQAEPAAPARGLGTDTPHYWFYKLEYLLWEKWFNSVDTASKPELLKKGANIYRMRHVTSVEHVSPQSQNNGKITAPQLDRFGNLALLSIGENSTYSDKAPDIKKAMFVDGLSRGIIQSLKLADIFSSDSEWSDTAMGAHEAAMIAILFAAHPEQSQGASA